VAKLRKIVKGPTFTIRIDLHLGHGHCTMHTCDLTEDYVTFNKGEYANAFSSANSAVDTASLKRRVGDRA